ncbi:MAG TPA: polyprenyl synthetase family protein [Candidatus Saccharimonadales bacterium]|nr:polyprenyl synthetase family protein [Candidatus Saccharimonadales bacterium]
MEKAQEIAYFKQTYKKTLDKIDKKLNLVNDLVAPTFAANDPMRLESQRFIVQGGKRLRPALAQTIAGSYGFNDVWPSLALETFHKYILTHDDIIDRDEMRYGNPTVHTKMQQICINKTEAEHFGNSLAIVAGDLMESATYKIILTSELSADKKVELCKLMADAMDNVGWGWYDQFLMDYEELDSSNLSFERIEKSIIWVTGKYSIELPMRFGFALAGENTPKQLEAFTSSAGLLYQTKDDIMGLFGKVEDTGKSNFGDISQGKKTLPMWLAYANSGDSDKRTLEHLVGNKNLTSDEAQVVREIVKSSGALSRSQDMMREYRDACLNMVQEMHIKSDLKKFLRGFVYYLEDRDR